MRDCSECGEEMTPTPCCAGCGIIPIMGPSWSNMESQLKSSQMEVRHLTNEVGELRKGNRDKQAEIQRLKDRLEIHDRRDSDNDDDNDGYRGLGYMG